MKKILIALLVLGFYGNSAYAQSADQVTTEYTQSEKLLDATIICLDAVEAPTKYNEFAKQFISAPSFPLKKVTSTREDYQQEISNWLTTNSSIIEKVLVERKKAHDILYGPRPY